MNSAKRIFSLFLVLVCLMTCLPAIWAEEADTPETQTETSPETPTETAPETEVELPEEIFLTQVGSGTCTLCSATMMIRSAMYINGSHDWEDATETVMRRYGWYNGVGLKWDFTYSTSDTTVRVGHKGVYGFTVQGLKDLLDEHPEGIVLYCGNLPHAVFLFDYEGDTFYCAETVNGYSGKKIALEDSWLGYKYGSQARVLANATAYWYIKEYTDETGTRDCGCTGLYAGTYVCTTNSSELMIRDGHGTGYSIVGTIPSGAQVQVHKTSGNNGWAHVSYNGVNGYCSMKYLQLVELKHSYTTTVLEPTCTEGGYTTHTCSGCGNKLTENLRAPLGHAFGEWTETGSGVEGEQIRSCERCDVTESRVVVKTRMGTITASSLRIRENAGTGYAVMGFLVRGDRVEILETKDVGSSVWGRIAQGWISMDYVQLDEDVTETPVEPTEPEVTEPEVTEPEVTEPEVTEPEVTEPEVTEPEVTEPEVTEPEVTEPEVTEPEVTEPEVTEPEVTEPEEPKTMGTITASCLCVREGAGTGYRVVGYLYRNERVEILETKDAGGMTWGRTAQGWIAMAYVELDEPVEETPDEPWIVTVTASCLRVRREPTTASAIVDFLYWGAQVEILETKNVNGTTWGRTATGWISMDYVV